MPDKKTYNQQEREALLQSFGTELNDQSLRIIEKFKNTGKDLNKMLKSAWKFKHLC